MGHTTGFESHPEHADLPVGLVAGKPPERQPGRRGLFCFSSRCMPSGPASPAAPRQCPSVLALDLIQQSRARTRPSAAATQPPKPMRKKHIECTEPTGRCSNFDSASDQLPRQSHQSQTGDAVLKNCVMPSECAARALAPERANPQDVEVLAGSARVVRLGADGRCDRSQSEISSERTLSRGGSTVVFALVVPSGPPRSHESAE